MRRSLRRRAALRSPFSRALKLQGLRQPDADGRIEWSTHSLTSSGSSAPTGPPSSSVCTMSNPRFSNDTS
eukprot:2523145-Pyramimonas_sp.AAC.1